MGMVTLYKPSINQDAASWDPLKTEDLRINHSVPFIWGGWSYRNT